jgi:hypothetical protein
MKGIPVDYVAPAVGEDGFNCPYCGAFANQSWDAIRIVRGKSDFTKEGKTFKVVRAKVTWTSTPGFGPDSGPPTESLPDFSSSTCGRCGKRAFWFQDLLIFPALSSLPLPLPSTPDGAKKIYMEARAVFGSSPRASAALLRVALEELTEHLGASGKDLRERIVDLKGKGLPEQVVKSMDILRIVGNHSVHPGLIDLDDDPETSAKLFTFFNLIVMHTIVLPAEVDELHGKLPAAKRVTGKDA